MFKFSHCMTVFTYIPKKTEKRQTKQKIFSKNKKRRKPFWLPAKMDTFIKKKMLWIMLSFFEPSSKRIMKSDFPFMIVTLPWGVIFYGETHISLILYYILYLRPCVVFQYPKEPVTL